MKKAVTVKKSGRQRQQRLFHAKPLETEQIKTLRFRLNCWFRSAHRTMPWRKTRDPYAIWLSEVMLQQTQVTTVIPYYNKFLTRFPDVKSLAMADIRDVLSLWAGLGYYRRAHQLHRSAREILEKHKGRLPSHYDALLQLPGFGPYTAGAVASIAFGEPVPAVDGNVLRVMTRILADPRDIQKPAAQRELRQRAAQWVPARNAGLFNQALMELGATVCTAQNPRCPVCPVRTLCRSYQAGNPTRYPFRNQRDARRRIYLAAIFACSPRGRVLMAERPASGLWAGLWELPSLSVPGTAAPVEYLWPAPALRKLGLTLAAPQPMTYINHTLTHREITAWLYHCSAPAGTVDDMPRDRTLTAADGMPEELSSSYIALQWVDNPFQLPLSVLARKQLDAAEAAGLIIP